MLRLPSSSQVSRCAASNSAARRAAVPSVVSRGRPARGSVVRVRASNEPGESATQAGDFDAYIMKMADAWEKSENKVAVAGYAAAALGAFFFSEWLIHLPALDILLGFPVQLVGLLAIPVLVLRWGVDGKDAAADITDVVNAISKKLPGLDGKK